MTLIKFEPMREIENFNDKIQKFFGEFPCFGFDLGITFNPKIDISEDDKSIYVEAEIPGVKKEDLKLSLQDNILTITGEKRQEVEDKKEKNFYRSERSYGTFTRSFTLPAEINRDSVDAQFKDGILKVSIQKAHPRPANEKMIDIK